MAAPAVSTVQIKPSSYVVKDAATTTTIAEVAAADPEGRSAAEQSYVVHKDEYPVNIAQHVRHPARRAAQLQRLGRQLQSDYPARGGTVRIPPGAKFIDPNATTTTAAGAHGRHHRVVGLDGLGRIRRRRSLQPDVRGPDR